MDYEKLVAELRDWLPPESEKIPYGELVGAPYPYNLQGPLVYADEVCNLVEEAADAITALLDENALKNRKSMWRKLLEAVKSAFGWGTKERRTLMDIEKLRKSLLENSDPDGPCIEDDLMQAAATALSTLQAENEKLRAEVESLKKGHCAGCSIPAVKAEQIRDLTDAPKLRAELERCREKNAGLALALLTECAPNPDCLGDDEWRAIRVELERVKAERDAAVEDVAAIIGDVEEIRRGYDVGNADADGAFARLCETYCANNGCLCYAECEKYHCKNFKWRGRKED